MNEAAQTDFLLKPGLVLLNHASYGITSRRVLTAAEPIRNEIESDPTRCLGAELTGRLREQTAALTAFLGLHPAQATLTSNATSGAAAIIDSVRLRAGQTVVALDTEYSSILRAWDRACERAGATLVRVPVRLPFANTDEFLAELDGHVPGGVSYLQVSLVSSSSAIHFPMRELGGWVRGRGGRMIVDAAHCPGHVPLDPLAWGSDAVFGTVHKWLPTLRPVGFLWLTEGLIDLVRPAEVSLTWDSDDLIERFSWPGTFDPVPRLSLDAALDQWQHWHRQGVWSRCKALADEATELLSAIGARPTATPEFAPPRLRAFVLDDISVDAVREHLTAAGIRAWVGPGADGECILRIATHVYNDSADIEALLTQIIEVLAR